MHQIFAVMSNGLIALKILICPSDDRAALTNVFFAGAFNNSMVC